MPVFIGNHRNSKIIGAWVRFTAMGFHRMAAGNAGTTQPRGGNPRPLRLCACENLHFSMRFANPDKNGHTQPIKSVEEELGGQCWGAVKDKKRATRELNSGSADAGPFWPLELLSLFGPSGQREKRRRKTRPSSCLSCGRGKTPAHIFKNQRQSRSTTTNCVILPTINQ